MKLKTNLLLTLITIVITSVSVARMSAQETKDTAKKAEFKPSGKVWGYVFGDYAFKTHADSLGSAGNNNSSANALTNINGRKVAANTQYSGLPTNFNSFNLRRIYLGYDYNISERFSASVLLAHESGVESNSTDPSLTGDLKRAFYIKAANVRCKNIIPGGDLVIGQQATPTFATMSEKIWGYRAIEKTITDMRSPLTGSSSTDLGVGLFGHFDKKENYGYEVMVGNGSGAKFETNSFKKIYSSLYAWFFNKKIVVQANYDYDRTALQVSGANDHQSKTMMKAFVAYQSDPITVGVEAYMQTIQNVNTYKETSTATKIDTADASSMGVSAFVRGRIIKEKLGFYARYDMFNPDTKFNNAFTYTSTGGTKSGYNVTETFITAGLDYTPIKNVHIMPNIWINSYTDHQLTNTTGTGVALTGKKKSDYDMVARLTFWYIFK
ncbi:MAG: hypothetical protein ACXVP4_00895 [Bacteroidia bacterium]